MNRQELLNYLNIKPKSIKKIGSASIVTTNDKKYVIKKNNRKADSFEYLQTRNFNNFPKVYSNVNDEIELTDYVEERITPKEQKLEDLVYLTSILHAKTTFYKNIDEDYQKNIYESIIEKQTTMFNYYSDLQNMIELEIYMTPSNYLLIRNISLIYLALRKSREYLDKWYEIIKEDSKIRFSYIHGNLDESHFIESDDLYLISWDKSRVDLPIYDLEIFYKKSFQDINLADLLNIYESKYQLKKEELYLLITLLLIPEKINFNQEEYPKTKQVTKQILYMNKVLSYLENNTNETNHYTNH